MTKPRHAAYIAVFFVLAVIMHVWPALTLWCQLGAVAVFVMAYALG
jgi:hypothetical protein